jgi:HEAT repeat protein
MTDPGAPKASSALLAIAACGVWLGICPAYALPPPPTQGPVNPNAAAPEEDPESVTVLVRGLRHADAVERRYAARALGREAALAARISDHSAPGSDRDIEARLVLQELDRLATEPCLAAFDHAEVRRGCARVFLAVEATVALPALEAALAQDLGLLTRRAVEDAVARLRVVSAEEPS